MDDEILVRMRDGLAHDDEQCDARRERESLAIAPRIDALAVDVFEHEIAFAAGSDAGIEQARDVRIVESSEQTALAREPFIRAAIRGREPQQLDRRESVVQTIRAAGEPNLRHAAR